MLLEGLSHPSTLLRQIPAAFHSTSKGRSLPGSPQPHLHLQLHNVIHRPGLVIVVIVGDGGEAAGPLLVCDPALGQVLGRAGAADAVLRDAGGHIRCVEIVTFKYFNVD